MSWALRRAPFAASRRFRYRRRKHPWRRIVLAGAVGLALLFGWSAGQSARGQVLGQGLGQGLDHDRTATYGEYSIKAAVLYNFAKFTQWPDTAGRAGAAPIRICVLGQDPFGAALDVIDGRRIGDRVVVTARVSTAAEARSCQILFIGASEAESLAAIFDRLRHLPVLTVTDLPRGAASRGIVRLETVARKIRFVIDTERAAAAGLSFSSKLLALAGPRGGAIAADTPPQPQSDRADPNG